VEQLSKITNAVAKLSAVGTQTSLFIDAAVASKAPYIEIHTGKYADAITEEEQQAELDRLIGGIKYANAQGLKVNTGHGLNYFNVTVIPHLNQH
jgi:pyridoxine 5-phosphate synthase